ncbi:cytochrome P450 [Vararia minispora EC-137]|uniref:Cytochrome P450 n=1 Tax=Vararia minispora EC-137 TaxID=1314806 RepID=A0ACB8QDA9_9AGAM|nr:cytochrome P450 [Vararia minispora EC-137]
MQNIALVITVGFTTLWELWHLPRVPILPLLVSYIKAEPEDKRIRRLILPFVNNHGHGLVLVWALGRWMVHIINEELGAEVFGDIHRFPKEDPPDDLLLWQLIGKSNILLSNGEQWKKHSRNVRSAINRAIPMQQFSRLSYRLCTALSRHSIVAFDEYAQRFALDAVGTTAFGHDFDAIEQESEFATSYNQIMRGIANPLYLIMPFLEKVFPRRDLKRSMDGLAQRFQDMLQEKREKPGQDMLTYMLRDVGVTDDELRDNMLLLFIAGHDTSAAGISTLVYYLAKHPDIQNRARCEVLGVLGKDGQPTLESQHAMPYLAACIREALRINTPISYLVPRAASSATQLGRYLIPAHTSIVLNLYAIHHSEHNWTDPFTFSPDRFLRWVDDKDANERKWVPFGMGQRQCPARAFAFAEQMALTAVMLREYEWELPEASPHTDEIQNAFSPFALTVPHKLYVRFTRRDLSM